jgi:hypothetical protein
MVSRVEQYQLEGEGRSWGGGGGFRMQERPGEGRRVKKGRGKC